MDLTLNHRGDYAVRAALFLAAAWDGSGAYRKIREVSNAMELPASFTPQILGLLSAAGLAEAKAGRDGGYRLTRPPEEITILEVVEAAEGELASEHCALRGGPCYWEDVCALHPTWLKASEAIREALASTTLSEVVGVDRDLRAGRKPSPPPPSGHRLTSAEARRRRRTEARSRARP